MNKYEYLSDIAEEEMLELIETTDSNTGYPSHIEPALIGFDSWEQLKEVAEKYDLIICEFSRRDGWRLWFRRHSYVSTPYEIDESQFGPNVEIWKSGTHSDYFDFAIDQLKNDTLVDFDIDWRRIEREEDFHSLNVILGYYERLQDEGDEDYEDYDFNEIYDIIKNHIEIYDAIKNLDNEHAVLTNYGELQEPNIDITFTSYHDDDVTAYALGLMCNDFIL